MGGAVVRGPGPRGRREQALDLFGAGSEGVVPSRAPAADLTGVARWCRAGTFGAAGRVGQSVGQSLGQSLGQGASEMSDPVSSTRRLRNRAMRRRRATFSHKAMTRRVLPVASTA